MELTYLISPTGLSTYTDCRLQWYWGNAMGYKTARRDEAFDLGIGVHVALADYYEFGYDPIHVFTKWVDGEIRRLENNAFHDIDAKILYDVRAIGIIMLMGYLEHYKNEQYEIVWVERETVSRPVPGREPWAVHARVDMLVRDPRRGNKLYVMEHKTFTQLTLEYLDLDHQFVAEAWLAEGHQGERVEGVIYNGLRKQAPSPCVKNPLFERHYIDVGPQQVRHFLRRCIGMIDELEQDKFVIYPEPNTVKCSRCRFRVPCAQYMRGEDYKYTLGTMFTKRGARPSENH